MKFCFVTNLPALVNHICTVWSCVSAAVHDSCATHRELHHWDLAVVFRCDEQKKKRK